MRKMALLAAAVVFCTVGPAYALYSVSLQGEWPKSWPIALEPLRKQARTLVGPMIAQQHHAIPFSTREEFEAAWEHILKVKTAGAPVFLITGPNFFLGAADSARLAGVVVHAPPVGQADNPETPKAPIQGVKNVRERWMNTTYIDLVVDGDVVDLNRVRLPADTPIVDERFRTEEN